MIKSPFSAYCTATYNRPQELHQAINAVLNGTVLPATITIFDNSPEQYAAQIITTPLILDMAAQYDIQLQVYNHPENIGLVGAWNRALTLHNDYVILANDDVIVHKNTLYELGKTVLESTDREAVIFGAKDAYSFFVLKQQAFQGVGGWDEFFWPLYYDDNDIDRRLRLFGYTTIVSEKATFNHIENGSATLKAYNWLETELHHQRFQYNIRYYMDKWGGMPGHEHYTIPFNGNNHTKIITRRMQEIEQMRRELKKLHR
jgi:GT2 family glycosyltransferase